MAFDFPSSPTNGQVFTPSGGPTYTYDSAGTKWTVSPISATVPISSGVYTPTHYLYGNAAGSTAHSTTYLRIADRVIVSGVAEIDPTLTATTTSLAISLPVPSAIVGTEDCTGTVTAPGFTETGYVTADVAGDLAVFTWQAATPNNHTFGFIFQYKVL